MDHIDLKNKVLNRSALKAYGFVPSGDTFEYCVKICEGQFALNVTIERNGHIKTKLIDLSLNEEYVLHLIPDSSGSFVGRIREEYSGVIEDIAASCYEPDVFKSESTKEVIKYAREKYGDEPEYLWRKFPDNAVLRRKDSQKWYAALLTVSKRKLGIDSDDTAEIIDLRMSPEGIEKLIDNRNYFPGYHMNKKHWFTILLDGSVPVEEIISRMDESYGLAVKK